ncbi:MAG: serine/threonine-protein kinase, partial [Myxococcota bacterium]
MTVPPAPTPAGAPAVALSPSPQPGDLIGAYRVESVIQRSGMGEVFLVAKEGDAQSEQVVLKRLALQRDDEDDYAGMFRAEIAVMSRLKHPQIVSTIDSFETDAELGLTLEFVRGRNLLQMQRACMADGIVIHPGVGAHIMVQILEGLHYAHTRVLDDGRSLNLVHRDITPGNILIGFDGTVKLTDFGIAKSVLSDVKTRVGVVKGTTRYLSPEQIRAQPITVQSDVFSAAVVLTELLTGKPLFDRGSVAPTLFAIVNKERPKVSKLLSFEAPELAIVLESALDTDPRRRPPTARAFADGLRWAAQAQGWSEDRTEVRDLMKRLFPESMTAPDRVPSTIKATAPRLDLTYLLEVSSNAEDEWSNGSTTHIEEELRVLLQGMVSGSAPLDASQFVPSDDE